MKEFPEENLDIQILKLCFDHGNYYIREQERLRLNKRYF
jgi:hypothetical protein